MKLIKQLLSLFLIWTSSSGFQSKNFITNNHKLHQTKLQLTRRDIISKTSSFLTYINFNDKEKTEEEPEKPTEIIIPNPSIVSNSQLNIRIVGEITEENCARLGDIIIHCDNMAKQLNEETNTTNPISIHITSMGGSLMPTLYICDLIKYIDTEVHTFVDGYAASSASLISICGDKRFITKHSSMLIHQLSGDASGKFTEIKDKYSHMEQLMNNVADIYLTNTKLSPENLAYLLQHDIWLNSTTCLQLGLVDQIL
jgi:ATP-dependent protease ClpP protease subunit